MLKDILRRVAGPEFMRSSEERERRETSGYTVAAAESVAGTKHRYEDAFFCMDDAESYGVFDGMSTSPRGDRAAQLARDVIRKEMQKMPITITPGEAELLVYNAIAKANTCIYEDAIKQGWVNKDDARQSTNATTVVVLRVCRPVGEEPCVVIGHIGDSRAYLQYRDGSLEPQTVDHSLMQRVLRTEGRVRTEEDAMEAQRMFSTIDNPSTLNSEDQALYKMRNVVTEMAGIFPDTEPVIKTVPLEGVQGFLLVTDGISDNFTEDTIARKSEVGTGEASKHIARRLAYDAHERGISGKPGAKNDDATAVFGMFQKPEKSTQRERELQARRGTVDTSDRAIVADANRDRILRWSKRVEAASTFDSLMQVIRGIGVVDIEGKMFDPDTVIETIEVVVLEPEKIKYVTRTFGIREQVRHLLEIREQARAARRAASRNKTPDRP